MPVPARTLFRQVPRLQCPLAGSTRACVVARRWLEQYPANPKGDPGSRWWAPLGPEGERELLGGGWGSGGEEGVVG